MNLHFPSDKLMIYSICLPKHAMEIQYAYLYSKFDAKIYFLKKKNKKIKNKHAILHKVCLFFSATICSVMFILNIVYLINSRGCLKKVSNRG